MQTWVIEPRDPLIVRDGRPFGPQPGARATSLRFPYPSTTTGGVRTRAGLNADGVFDEAPQIVRGIEVRGPLLVELDDCGEIAEWLAPAPADALLLTGKTGPEFAARRRLAPVRQFEGATTDLSNDLELMGMPRSDPAKSLSAAPRFWYWHIFEHWLSYPPMADEQEIAYLGHDGPQPDRRMHVSIDHESGARVEGALFQTSGLEFTRPRRVDDPDGGKRLALAVAATTDKVRAGPAPLGGERRLAVWRSSHQGWPDCPHAVRQHIVAHGHCRMVLLTPAHFANGSRPEWLLHPCAGVTAEVCAAAMARPQVVSGWDFEWKRPKSTRKLMPSGSVLFLRLHGDKQAIENWVCDTWMQAISDEAQDRRDGFGLAALGTWDGTLWPMEDAR